MPCLSSSADSVLNESISVSNAESQLAVPLSDDDRFRRQRDFLAEGIGGLNRRGGRGRRRRGLRGGGRCGGAAGGFGAGLAAGAGAGVADAAGVAGERRGERGGDCASAWPRPSEIAATGISATRARRKQAAAIHSVFSMALSRARLRSRVPAHVGEVAAILTRKRGFRPMTDMSWALRCRQRASTQIHHTGQSAVIRHIRQA